MHCFPERTVLDLPQLIMEALFLMYYSFHLLFQSSIFCLHLPAYTVYDSVTFCFVLTEQYVLELAIDTDSLSTQITTTVQQHS